MDALSGDGYVETGPSQFQGLHVPGLPVARLQCWRVSVAADAGLEREHIVVMAYHPLPSEEACDQIAPLLRSLAPMALLSFVQADSEGHAQVRTAAHAGEVAAAVTEVKRRGSWDESPVLRIVVQSQAFAGTIRWQMDHAEARVRAEAA